MDFEFSVKSVNRVTYYRAFTVDMYMVGSARTSRSCLLSLQGLNMRVVISFTPVMFTLFKRSLM